MGRQRRAVAVWDQVLPSSSRRTFEDRRQRLLWNLAHLVVGRPLVALQGGRRLGLGRRYDQRHQAVGADGRLAYPVEREVQPRMADRALDGDMLGVGLRAGRRLIDARHQPVLRIRAFARLRHRVLGGRPLAGRGHPAASLAVGTDQFLAHHFGCCQQPRVADRTDHGDIYLRHQRRIGRRLIHSLQNAVFLGHGQGGCFVQMGSAPYFLGRFGGRPPDNGSCATVRADQLLADLFGRAIHPRSAEGTDDRDIRWWRTVVARVRRQRKHLITRLLADGLPGRRLFGRRDGEDPLAARAPPLRARLTRPGRQRGEAPRTTELQRRTSQGDPRQRLPTNLSLVACFGLRTAPQPAERVGQDRPAVLAAVLAGAADELVVVVFEFQGRRHLLIGQPPVAELVVQIVAAVLKKDADRLVGRGADQRRIDVAAADVGEAADVAEHLAESVGPLPGDGERADAARGDAANRPALGVVGQLVLLADLRQDLLQQEPGVLVAERVVLEAAVAGLLRVLGPAD